MVEFISPEQIINQVELKNDMTVAEFGCGSGNIVLTLAKKLKEGKVYGLDVQEEPLSVLKGRARSERLFNIETIRCDLEKECGSTLPNEFVDIVLIPNLLFQVDEKKAVLKEAQRITKKGGQVLVVDWKKESSLGPKEGRVSPEEVKMIAEELKLKLEKEFEMGNFHYGLIFRKVL